MEKGECSICDKEKNIYATSYAGNFCEKCAKTLDSNTDWVECDNCGDIIEYFDDKSYNYDHLMDTTGDGCSPFLCKDCVSICNKCDQIRPKSEIEDGVCSFCLRDTN